MDGLMKTLDLYLVKKAPALPKNVKDILVSVAPWLEVIEAEPKVSTLMPEVPLVEKVAPPEPKRKL